MLKTIAGCGAAIVGALLMTTSDVAEAGTTNATVQSDIIAIDVLLDPDSTAIAAATGVNGKVRQAFPASFALGDTHAPHITMMQRYVHANDLSAIEAAVAGVLAKQDPRSLKLQIQRLHAASAASLGMPSTGLGDIGLLFLLVQPTPELKALQHSVADALAPYTAADGDASAFVQDPGETINAPTLAYVKEFVPKESGDNYFPHITTGMGPMPVLQKIEAEPLQTVTFSPASVSIYHLGNFGTARTRLWTWTPPAAASATMSMPTQQ